MPSTYTTSLRIQLQADGENSGTWGQITNTNFQLFEQAISGYLSLDVTGGSNVTLTSNNGSADQSRNQVLDLTGVISGNFNVVTPNVPKTYIVNNRTTGSFTLGLQPSGGTASAIPQGGLSIVYLDGANNAVVMTPVTATNAALTSPTITGGHATSLTLTSPSGVVTSVGAVDATNGGISVSGAPITGSGNMTLGFSAVDLAVKTPPTATDYIVLYDAAGVRSARSLVSLVQIAGSGGGTTNFLRADGAWTTPGGAGTVTSVRLTTSSTGLSITGTNPITTSGTMTLTLGSGIIGTQTAGTTNQMNPVSVRTVHTQAHSLGQVPDHMVMQLICNTAELGFGAGEALFFVAPIPATNPADDSGVGISADATNTYITVGQNILVNQRSAIVGTVAAITPARWQVKAFPYKVN